MLDIMLSNAEQYNIQCLSMLSNAERPERVKDSKRGKRWRRWKHGRQKNLQKPVPRAAAAYGRQLKILEVPNSGKTFSYFSRRDARNNFRNSFILLKRSYLHR